MYIRQEHEDEFDKIYTLVKTAFKTARVSDGNEQDFVIKLRNSKGYIPELALVAEECGELIGHIMLTNQSINSSAPCTSMLLLAPISVVLEKRNQGIDGAFIKESFRIAKSLGYTSVFLVGNPAYYNRFGFYQTTDWGIKNTNGIPDEYVMACELEKNALNRITGTITFAE